MVKRRHTKNKKRKMIGGEGGNGKFSSWRRARNLYDPVHQKMPDPEPEPKPEEIPKPEVSPVSPVSAKEPPEWTSVEPAKMTVTNRLHTLGNVKSQKEPGKQPEGKQVTHDNIKEFAETPPGRLTLSRLYRGGARRKSKSSKKKRKQKRKTQKRKSSNKRKYTTRR